MSEPVHQAQIDAARTGAGGYVAADGAVEFDTSSHIVTATKP